MNSQISLYDTNNIDTLPWPESEVAILLKKYIVPLIKEGTSSFIKNVKTQLFALKVDDLVLPITVNDCELENSYVCSPYTHYITYAKEELHKLNNYLLEVFLDYLLASLGILLKLGKINKVVIINNWLVSTNLYPSLSLTQISSITSFLKAQFPQHTIIFRSINTGINKQIFAALSQNNYFMIASRQIYFINPQNTSSIKGKAKWLLKKDFRLLDQGKYEVIDSDQILLEDIPRIEELYNALYLDKYSYKNPQFNQKFLALALKEKIFHIKVIKKNGKIDGVIGFYVINGVMTTPLFGYDTDLPLKLGLYRMISAQLILEATERGLILNQSSGAAEFKRCRGGIANVEYNAVYYQHLPLYRQLIWRLLGLLINKIGIPLLKKYKL